MDCAPLNLAHFHERRADKFLKHHRYDEAYKAIETSLLYVHDAYKNALIPKSIEVLDTQKRDYQRKLRQIQMRKLQHERLKLKEIVPSAENNSVLLKPDSNAVSALSISKSIDKTIKDFDDKFNNLTISQNSPNRKENYDPRDIDKAQGDMKPVRLTDTLSLHSEDSEDFPSLAPLELPAFDFNVFTTSPTASLAGVVGLVESFQR